MPYKDPEKRKAYLREYGHRPEVRAHWKEYMRDRLRRIHKDVIEHYGGKCTCCGETEYKFLTIDHINGGGHKHVKEIGGNLPSWVVKNGYPDDFQVLCYNCNCAKGAWGECPHGDRKE